MKELTPGANPIVADAPLRGETAYIYALKRRAQRHHCMGYGAFTVDLTGMEQWRREYSRSVAPITDVPLLVKATALAISATRRPTPSSFANCLATASCSSSAWT